MENKKIIIDRIEPNSAAIRSGMDFNKVIDRVAMPGKPWYTTKKIFLAGVAVVVIAVIMVVVSLLSEKTVVVTRPTKQTNEALKALSINKNQEAVAKKNNNEVKKDIGLAAAGAAGLTAFTRSNTAGNSAMRNNADQLLLKEYYEKQSVKTQLFSIDQSRDTIITGEQGTRLAIKANCFVDRDNKAVQGIVNIKLKECYSIDDMLKENLSTLANDKVLESGGMIYLAAESAGKELQLKKYTEIEMSNPSSEIMQDTSMIVFYGEKDRMGEMNWVADNYSRMAYPVATLIEGKYHDTLSIEYFAKEFRFNKADMIKVATDSVVMDWKVSFNEMRKPIGSSVGKKEEGFPEFMQLFKEGNVPSIAAASWSTPFRFRVIDKESYDEYLERYKEYLKLEDLSKGNYTMKDGKRVFYARPNAPFFIGKVGWINCDKYKGPMVTVNNIAVKMNSEKNEKVKLVFKNGNRPSIIKPRKEGELWLFPNIPIKEEVTIIGTYSKNGKIYTSRKVFKVDRMEFIHELEYSVAKERT